MITINYTGDMPKIAAYTRISFDTEFSTENPKSVIERFVSEHFPNAKVDYFGDVVESGRTVNKLGVYKHLLVELLLGKYDILIVRDLSKLARRSIVGLEEQEMFRSSGIRIISVADSIDFPEKRDGMVTQLIFQMNEKKHIRS